MPTRAKRICQITGCSNYTLPGKLFCREHYVEKTRVEYKRLDDRRGSSTARGYGRDWRVNQREPFLRDHAWCEECQRQGRLTPARVVDHIVSRSFGGPDDPVNYQAMCDPCHNAKRRAEARIIKGSCIADVLYAVAPWISMDRAMAIEAAARKASGRPVKGEGGSKV